MIMMCWALCSALSVRVWSLVCLFGGRVGLQTWDITRLGLNLVINRVLEVAGESWNGGDVKHSAFWTDWLTMFMSWFAGLFVESRESLIISQRAPVVSPLRGHHDPSWGESVSSDE